MTGPAYEHWPTRGAAWIDPACWIVWLVFAGHVPREAEQRAIKVPAWFTAPRNGVWLVEGLRVGDDLLACCVVQHHADG